MNTKISRRKHTEVHQKSFLIESLFFATPPGTTGNHSQSKSGRKYLSVLYQFSGPLTKAAVEELRQSTLVCDRKNSLGPDGQSLPKQTSTSKATTLEDTCKMNLAFDADSVSLSFLSAGSENLSMKDTSQEMLLTWPHAKSIVTAAATDFQKMPANHNIGPGKTAAMVEEELGLHLTHHQVTQMQQMADLADYLNSTDALEEYKHLDSTLTVFWPI
ncbi:hypothetical protein IV203_003308 [Nitzschia inconspicua]|uniref:Uncharacterized protein n=1 Tax=Nitzschia inconspicua TaxID=303405 RepID=A0A9K3PNJ4_9STRA|nr:hypothetical protein IV203_003308 [Nitzschia inconspicua]